MTPESVLPATPEAPVFPEPKRASPVELHQRRLTQHRSRRILAAASGLGLLAEVLFGGHALGLSWPLFVGAFALALWRLSGRERWRQAGGQRWLLVPLAVFASMVAVRDSEPLTWGNLAACFGLASLLVQAFTGERLSGASAGRLLGLAAEGAARGLLTAPSTVALAVDAGDLRGGVRRVAGPALRAAALTVPLLLVFVWLLMAGDARFAQLVRVELRAIQWRDLVASSFTVLGVTVACSGLLAHALRRPAPEGSGASPRVARRTPLRFTDALVPLVALSGLFGLFGLVRLQAVRSFDKYAAAASPEFTYANEAHQSFGALMVAVVLTLAVLVLFTRLTTLESPRQERWFAGAGTALVVLTGPVLGSGLSRLWLYLEMYGYTELRVYATWAVLVAAVLLCWRGVTLWGWRSHFGVGAAVAVLASWAALNLFNPDAYIAEQNLARPQEIVSLDEPYLFGLSADAAPAVLAHIADGDLGPDERAFVERVSSPSGLAGWRWSRARARSIAQSEK